MPPIVRAAHCGLGRLGFQSIQGWGQNHGCDTYLLHSLCLAARFQVLLLGWKSLLCFPKGSLDADSNLRVLGCVVGFLYVLITVF